MEKPIIATTLSGLFIKQEPWDNAHKIWFENAANQLKDESVKQWINKENYFQGVDIVMQKLYPDLGDEKRTAKAREMFFDSVCLYIEKNPSVTNKQVVNYFKLLKQKYKLALITTNTQQALQKILSLTNLENLFDIIQASEKSEKDDKISVFEKFIKKFGKPLVYIGGNKKDVFDFCKQNNIKCVFVNFEHKQNLKNIKTVHNLSELRNYIQEL